MMLIIFYIFFFCDRHRLPNRACFGTFCLFFFCFFTSILRFYTATFYVQNNHCFVLLCFSTLQKHLRLIWVFRGIDCEAVLSDYVLFVPRVTYNFIS